MGLMLLVLPHRYFDAANFSRANVDIAANPQLEWSGPTLAWGVNLAIPLSFQTEASSSTILILRLLTITMAITVIRNSAICTRIISIVVIINLISFTLSLSTFISNTLIVITLLSITLLSLTLIIIALIIIMHTPMHPTEPAAFQSWPALENRAPIEDHAAFISRIRDQVRLELALSQTQEILAPSSTGHGVAPQPWGRQYQSRGNPRQIAPSTAHPGGYYNYSLNNTGVPVPAQPAGPNQYYHGGINHHTGPINTNYSVPPNSTNTHRFPYYQGVPTGHEGSIPIGQNPPCPSGASYHMAPAPRTWQAGNSSSHRATHWQSSAMLPSMPASTQAPSGPPPRRFRSPSHPLSATDLDGHRRENEVVARVQILQIPAHCHALYISCFAPGGGRLDSADGSGSESESEARDETEVPEGCRAPVSSPDLESPSVVAPSSGEVGREVEEA
ncbi:hypothetical protein N658DRAFT_560811 [Parathielavia hyrcaniae]|uniref:Uncharacterized protein n=1 Tax=Parathielavia hyrcaniae TaxID=113614 RepID=A0AAN6Q0I3_9PEZI|nr:hypothetical protein N658DRAFT_560811 [Parathielavia hyrcaniae]